MNAFFLPSVRLMNCLRFPQKFALIGIVLGALVLGLFGQIHGTLTTAIDNNERRSVGAQIIRGFFELVADTQRHRGLTSAVLDGQANLAGERDALSRKLAQSIKEIEDQLVKELVEHEQWGRIREDMQTIFDDVARMVASESLFRHTVLVEQLLSFATRIADSYGLTLDTRLGSYYLTMSTVDRLPRKLELIGLLRAQGLESVTRGSITEHERLALAGLVAELERASSVVETNLMRTAEQNPDVSERLEEATIQLLIAANSVSQLVMRDVVGERFELSAEEYFRRLSESIDRGYAIMSDILLPTLEAILSAQETELRQTRLITVSASGLAMLIALYLAVGTYLATIGSVRRLSEVAGVLATGDLRPRIDLKTRDELSSVSDSFNKMADSFVQLMKNVREGAGRVVEAAGKMTDAAGLIEGSTSEQADSAASIAAAIEQMTVSIDHISASAEQSDKSARHSGSLSANGAGLVNSLVEEIKQIAALANQTADSVERLGTQSEKISSIVSVIKEIADQTNLLALNAAIEAARAGESGRGFAVVADEVRKLAERTANSTEEIAGMVASIQGDTQSAVRTMREGAMKVDQGVVLASEAGQAMAEIEEGANQVVQSIGDISIALREQSSASTETAKNVEQVARAADENSAQVKTSVETAVQLDELARELNREVERFRFD